MPHNDQFFLSKPEPLKSCLLAMRSLLLNFNTAITETTKYGMPCFCYENKAFCYLWTDKKTDEPYFLIVDGNKINHPMLESGTRSRMKILRVDQQQDLNIEVIEEVLSLALKVKQG